MAGCCGEKFRENLEDWCFFLFFDEKNLCQSKRFCLCKCLKIQGIDVSFVSVLILNWNGKALLEDCLDSLSGQTFTDFEIVLVDNGSTDDSVRFVEENYPWVNLIQLPENRGFAHGNNLGLHECRGEYIVTLN